ncbi:hypothetical protein PTTG_08280 [Puccinia triticina 1-1 BBBD Race 1]|uniref:N-acetylglucosaminylphosphatidylinositol deacetylase n=1 Tax=Puccinia triticina (isolate 1-1 / race 1 (BBBD)) TaxID=630390 RepID=A0A180GK84_PUCT1|nr:hypothetical protein PTTG_08280 [Puccinia triticina 1-1 BBBD Race 1]
MQQAIFGLPHPQAFSHSLYVIGPALPCPGRLSAKMQQQQLYHRTNNTRQAQHRDQLIPSQNQAAHDEKKNGQPSPRTHPNHWTPKKALKTLISTAVIASLSIYATALARRDWPPDGRLRNPDGSADSFQGEWWVSPNLTRADRIMLVVAHPDDECLFFSPTLLNLLSPRFVNRTEFNSSTPHPQPQNNSSEDAQINLEFPRAHILSLSSGNADGLGIKRTREMRASCWAFGIPSPHCIVLDHPELPDSMSVWWPEDTIAEFVRLYVDLWDIDAIITFDHHGVSGHANHRAIAAALSRQVHSDPKFPMTFMLRSTWIFEKYTSLLSLPYTLYRHHRNLGQEAQNASANAGRQARRRAPTDSPLSPHASLFLSTPAQYWEGRRAFNQHRSQQVWFRRLWLITSRFMWINELQRVVPLESRFQDHTSFHTPSLAENIIFPVKPKKSALSEPDTPSSPSSPPTNQHIHTGPTPD